MEATQFLQEAQQKADLARKRIYQNTGVASMLLADIARLTADAQTRLEQIQMYISLARATPLKNRWGVGAAAKREDSEQAAKSAVSLSEKVLSNIELAQEKLNRNPELVETIIAKASQWLAQVQSQMARIQRLLTEASIGRG